MGAGQQADHRVAVGGALGLWLGQDAGHRGFGSGLGADAAGQLRLEYTPVAGPAFFGPEVVVRADATTAATAR